MVDITSIFQRYRDDVYRLALSYTRSKEEAEDVCQTVFLKLMEQKCIGTGKEKNWLMKTTANTCRNLLKSHWWKTTVPIEETTPAQTREQEGIMASIMKLEPKYRCVIYLHYYEGYSTKEIGALLKISQSAVTTRLSRGRQLLKTELEEV